MQNGTILQFFHWYYPNDGSLWKKIKEESPRLAQMGFTAHLAATGLQRHQRHLVQRL